MNINNILSEIDELIKIHQLGECGDYGDGFRDGLYVARMFVSSAAKERNDESRELDGYG